MKKIFKKNKQAPQGRITNETVAEHREHILAGGRRFKYPVQYTKHKLIINTILIISVVLVTFVLVSWWQLYKAQNTSTFYYRTVRIVPAPVASIDGQAVRYSDYLMLYRPVEHFMSQNGQLAESKDDRERQLGLYKRSAIDRAVDNAYAEKVALEKGIKVEEADINDVILRGRQASNGSISQDLYDASLLDTLGFSKEEYREMIKRSLLYSKVAYAVDDKAKELSDLVKLRVSGDKDFVKIAESIGKGVTVGGSGDYVQLSTPDGGVAIEASKLKTGEVSDVKKTTSSDGYYIVRLDGKSGDKVKYTFIKIPLTRLSDDIAKLRKDGKVSEFISIPAKPTKTQ